MEVMAHRRWPNSTKDYMITYMNLYDTTPISYLAAGVYYSGPSVRGLDLTSNTVSDAVPLAALCES